MNSETPLDLFIIGAGPIGLACGIEAHKARLKYLVADKGCLVNSLFNYPLNMTFFSTSEKLEIGNVPFISHHPKPNRGEALEYYRRVSSHWDLKLQLYTRVNDIRKENSCYRVHTSRGDFLTKAIVLATGFYDIPRKMGVEGEDLPKVMHYYKEPHPFAGQKVAVIGSANSAVDAALETYRKGAEVILIVRRDKISERVKYWVRPDIENRIKENAIKACFNSCVTRIREGFIDIMTPEGEKSIANDFVLAMTGYYPDFSLLQKAGVSIHDNETKTPVYDPDTMETDRENIYLAGVICGGLETHKWFIENSRLHAEMIIGDLKKKGL